MTFQNQVASVFDQKNRFTGQMVCEQMVCEWCVTSLDKSLCRFADLEVQLDSKDDPGHVGKL